MDFCERMTGTLLLNEIKMGSRKNLLLSPLSFKAVLNMVAVGATGLTLRQMSEFLSWKNVHDINSSFLELMNIASLIDDHNEYSNNGGGDRDGGGPIICLVNGVWVDKKYPLKASYQQFVHRVLKAQVKNADFATEADRVVEEANAWAKSITKGLVTDILHRNNIDSFKRIILGNALYFKGSWMEKFDRMRTKNLDFYLLNGAGKVSVPFMTGCEEYSYQSYDGFELVEIPYQCGNDGNRFSMFFFLPNENDGLENLLEKATACPGFFRQHFQLMRKKYDVFWIPKFKFKSGTSDGRKTMMDMGLKLPFEKDCKELTGLIDVNGETFYVSDIIQRTFIEVDEEGTEAVACTFGAMAGCSLNYKRTRFVADHPFIFMIREERSRLVLFTGAVLNPLLH